MFIVTLIDYLHESNKIGAMPQRTILKFKTIEDAYKSAFDDLDKKVVISSIYKFIDGKLNEINKFDCECSCTEECDECKPFEVTKIDGDIENVPNNILTGSQNEKFVQKKVKNDYLSIFSSDEIWGMNVISTSGYYDYMNYRTLENIKENLEKDKIVLWLSCQYDRCTCKICYLTKED